MPAAPKKPTKKPAVAAPPAPIVAVAPIAVEPGAEPEVEPEADCTSADTIDETVSLFAEAFSALALSIPPSVRKRIAAAIEKKGGDAAAETDDIKVSLEKAKGVYAAKKTKARVASKLRRDKVRAEKVAAAAAEPVAAEESVVTEECACAV